MRSVTLSTLRELVRQACDLPTYSTTTTVNTATVDLWINKAIHGLTGKLVTLHGEDYYTTSSTISTQAGIPNVSLPTRCFKLRRLVWMRGSDDPVPLRRASQDDWREASETSQAWDAAPVYALLGQTVQFWPCPSAVYSLRPYYVQLLADLSAAGDSVYLGPAWEDWIVANVGIEVFGKMEKDATAFEKKIARAELAISENAPSRNEDEPQFVRRRLGSCGSAYDRFNRATYED